MEALIPSSVQNDIRELVSVYSKEKNTELEIKVLAGQIHTRDVADRIVRAIEEITSGGVLEEHRASFSYSDGMRVVVTGPENIHKVCMNNSFRGVPLHVERKQRYSDRVPGKKDSVDVPELKLRFTLRTEEPLRKDFSGTPMDPTNHGRILHRKSWRTTDKMLRIDMSMVKTKLKGHKTIAEVLKQTPSYELEVEVLKRDAPEKDILDSMLRTSEHLMGAFQQSPFLLSESDIQRYRMDFEASKTRFINPVTMERRHLRADFPHNILSGYTVTNKADGERALLIVARDKRLLRISPRGTIVWTGLTATKDNHVGDILDGEYLADKNLFCIFDVYSLRGKNTMRLPLMTTDEDIAKDPLKSRLGCAHVFLQDLKKDFKVLPSRLPFRVETKLFLAGDGPVMEAAIQKMLDTKFEYETDGLIFTPKSSPVAPIADRKSDTWLRVYKWKPADQNSIDFLLRYSPGESYDSLLKSRVYKGTLYIGRNAGSDIVYPCETITGEYKPPTLPADLMRMAETQDYAPSPFQPSIPKAPDASTILLPLNERGVPVDIHGQRIEDNTIIECVRDVESGRWKVLRTRYDKTYQYRVLGRRVYGNDVNVAESIWTNIHNPVTEQMIRSVVSSPVDDAFGDDLYYRDNLEARDRVLKDVYAFHNKIKEGLYQTCVKPDDTLLELAVGRGGDLFKWKKTKPSKIVGIDISESNLCGTRQGAGVRYLTESQKVQLPPALFIVADMTQPLMQQENRYLKMLDRREPATTAYLEKFVGLTEFDDIACMFAIHYACESEELFRSFVGNLHTHGKGLFFGTCMDGQAVYSLLLGKSSHTFRSDKQVFGEMTKEYSDGDGWKEEFGQAIQVKLESFERSVREYLVPFERITEILKENGFELVTTNMFGDHYAQQNAYVFSGDQQAFSFLHRSFVFKRVEKKEEPAAEESVDIPVVEAPKEEAPKEEAPKEKKPVLRKRLVRKEPAEPLPEPVFFFTGNPALNENREFSNMFEAPMQIDGVTFPTVEHYFQWSKAKLFGDGDMAAKILKTPSPKSVKSYGKKVKDFKEDEWNEKKNEVMRIAIKAKFMQHPELRLKLVNTKDRPLAEANPRDKYWGIGTSFDTSKAKDPAKWPGKNVLGNILMDLRKELKTDAPTET